MAVPRAMFRPAAPTSDVTPIICQPNHLTPAYGLRLIWSVHGTPLGAAFSSPPLGSVLLIKRAPAECWCLQTSLITAPTPAPFRGGDTLRTNTEPDPPSGPSSVVPSFCPSRIVCSDLHSPEPTYRKGEWTYAAISAACAPLPALRPRPGQMSTPPNHGTNTTRPHIRPAPIQRRPDHLMDAMAIP